MILIIVIREIFLRLNRSALNLVVVEINDELSQSIKVFLIALNDKVVNVFAS